MSEPAVLIDRPMDHIARLRINRPDKRNAIDHAVRQALIEGLRAIQSDGATRALVLGGVDGILSAGGDIPTMASLSEEQAKERMRHVHAVCVAVAGLRIPVVTAMEGISAGAAVGLALLGDRIVVGPGTKVLFPFLRLGLTPDWGQLLTLPRRVGIGPARRMLTSGKAISGEEAARSGLADEIVQDGDVMATAMAIANEMAALPLNAFGRMKQRLNNPAASFAEEFALEVRDQADCLLGPEFKEGFAAFISKRTPDFTALHGGTLP